MQLNNEKREAKDKRELVSIKNVINVNNEEKKYRV